VTKRFFPQGEQVPGATSPADKLYYTRDQLGSVRELVNSSGTLVTRYSYDPYGRVTTTHTAANTSTPPIDATFQFTGDYVHATSGLNLTWYRAYDPNTGRWLSRDPLKNAEMRLGPNLYEYVLNNPIDKIDSLGLMFGAVPVIGTIEQAYNVYNNNVNGEKPSDYTAHPELGQTLCENDIDNQAFWKIAAFALPDAPKIGVDVGVGIATTALAPPAGAVVDGVGALDSLSALYIAFVAKDKIQNAANQAKQKCCQGQ
jgi:RHS repeat-associated protein